MKFFQNHASIMLLLLTLITLVSCEKEPPSRDKFIGSYQGNENCSSGNYNYSLSVSPSAVSDDGVILQNLGNFTQPVNVNATVKEDNLTINDTKNGITFSGTGSINGNTLTIIYTSAVLGTTDNCTLTCIKQ